MTSAANRVVSAILDGLGTPNIPVKLRLADGTVIDAVFNGYYDWPGRGKVPSIGYPIKSGHTHGPLRNGDNLDSKVPSPEEWDEMEKRRTDNMS